MLAIQQGTKCFSKWWLNGNLSTDNNVYGSLQVIMSSKKERLRNLIMAAMKYKKLGKNTISHSRSHNVPYGAARLSQDMATLVNNPQCSDIQFKVGGGDMLTTQENDSTVTLYAHSVILRCRSRYFAAMLDEEKNWKESSKGVIYKPNISPNTFQNILHYIYTGDLRAKGSENIVETIAAAEEMDLEELSIECQTKFIRTVEYIFSDEDDSNDESESGKSFEFSIKRRIPINVAIRTHIIPALNLASSHSLSYLSNKLITIMLPYMSLITKSPEAYTTFINKISFEPLAKIIASDNLAMTERNIWDLALSWAKLSKTAVETCLSNLDDKKMGDSGRSQSKTVISSSQLNELKMTLAPLLPSIRFSLLDTNDYADTLSFFLSEDHRVKQRHRFSEINRFLISINRVRQFDAPRMKSLEQKPPSKIIVEFAMWELLKKDIFEAGGINGCPSPNHMKFELLFRASKHGFLSSTFHQRCDNKGPTLVLIRSADGHLFGGVNFIPWKSDNSYSSCPLNFLFALPDGQHRNDPVIFKVNYIYVDSSSYNYIGCGPTFGGGYDLYIADSANINQYSHSYLPYSYHGSEASKLSLAGANRFTVSDYEVFSIST